MTETTFFKFSKNGKWLHGKPVIPIEDKKIVMELLKFCKNDSAKELNGDIFLEVPDDLSDMEISDKLKGILEPCKNRVICISEWGTKGINDKR